MNSPWLQSCDMWAEHVFAGSRLCDIRLERRLIDYAGMQARHPMGSTSEACEANNAAREGAYRLLENPRVSATGIDEGPYQQCAEAIAGRTRVLAIQDTTSVRVHYRPLAEEVQEEGCPTGFLVHTQLMVCAENGLPLGIADQQRWLRDKKRPGKGKRRERPYEEKESYRWQRSVELARERMSQDVSITTVADRESDIYEFLNYHVENGLDFVVRASWNRRTKGEVGHVLDEVRLAPVLGERPLRIEQRGAQQANGKQSKRNARKRADVITQLQATAVVLRPPQGRGENASDELAVNVVRVSGPNSDGKNDGLEWIILTTRPIETVEEVNQVVRDYEHRWLIEEYFKCWKTGCRVETRPLQTFDAVERMLAITAAIGLRILQIQVASNQPDAKERPTQLDHDTWRCLWVSTSLERPPQVKPSIHWAYRAIAQLGGWYDTKKTGRVGWATLWKGWARLEERLEGWRAAKRLQEM